MHHPRELTPEGASLRTVALQTTPAPPESLTTLTVCDVGLTAAQGCFAGMPLTLTGCHIT